MKFRTSMATAVLLGGALLLSGCNPFTRIDEGAAMKGLDGTWTVAFIAGEEIKDKSVVPTITIDSGNSTLSGHNGCNTFRGRYSFEDGKLKARLAETRMACPNDVATAASNEIRTVLDEGAEVVKVEMGVGRVLMFKSESAELRLFPPEASE
ncbi:META domain-containing protein [Wenzhouxiangella sp. XN24]|uniref:META domain-containing protein n=1 Tax=Wenzhouxiangella sp. XN24 TaxID=2713569 RepID=UPI0013EAB380|nr:META domain-containing protein [Wenzhouxiangella sp. XN24]NGX14780.1 META domain-containing protein [Wenzhouxiangella sp. XN24]